MEALEWMAWTPHTALFFAFIVGLIATFTVWGLRKPSLPRKGFLPMETARGDRLFLGLLGSAFIHLGWLGLTDLSLWFAVALSVLYVLVLGRWG
jgi:predicted small integral membrane protein